MTHAELSESAIRPPGCAPSTCPGELYRVNGSGEQIGNDRDPIIDDAQCGEGPHDSTSFVWLYRCSRCRATQVVAEYRDMSGNLCRRLRNDYDPKPIPDRAASNGEAAHAVRELEAIS